MARRPAVDVAPSPPRGIVLRDFRASYGSAFLSFKEGQAVPADADFQAFAERHGFPIRWSAT